MDCGSILELICFRIKDSNILRFIRKTPAAGVVEDGRERAGEKGPGKEIQPLRPSRIPACATPPGSMARYRI
jgi:hypothetical protein